MKVSFRVACYLAKVIESVPYSKAVETAKIERKTAALVSK